MLYGIIFLMLINDYYKNLSKTLSGNYLAMLGFVLFTFPTITLTSTVLDSIINNNLVNINTCFQEYLKIISCFLPITCLYALLPLFLLFIFLFAPKTKVKLPMGILLVVICFIGLTQISTFDFNPQNTEMYLFIPLIFFPIPLTLFILFFILLLLDLTRKLNIKNLELVNNKYYQLFVNIFFPIGLIIFTFAPILYLSIVIPN